MGEFKKRDRGGRVLGSIRKGKLTGQNGGWVDKKVN